MTSTRLLVLHFDFVERCMKISDLMHLAAGEAGRLPRSIDLVTAVRALRKERGEAVDKTDETLKSMKRLVPLVEEERKRGFAFYHGLGAIALWSALEATITDCLLHCLHEVPQCLKAEAVGRIKVPLAVYGLDADERHAFILEEVDRLTDSRLKPGVGRFEAALSAFGLDGAADDELRACVLEHSEVRNVLVHCKGKPDKRLIQHCPWLGYERGEDVQVSASMLTLYATSSLLYATNVIRRGVVLQGGNVERLDDLTKRLGGSLARTRDPKGGRTTTAELPLKGETADVSTRTKKGRAVPRAGKQRGSKTVVASARNAEKR